MVTIQRVSMLIAGELCQGESGSWIDSISPSTEKVLGAVPAAFSADVDRAVDAAIKAQRDWARRSMEERGKMLRRLASAIR
jgi:acyl-CoA reductase-like NAD-dependent aldehyde dehydrogenase